MDRLEKFIQQHKQELDVHEPPPGLWDRIEPRVTKKKSVRPVQFLRIAATLILVFGVSFAIWNTAQQQERNVDALSAGTSQGPHEFSEIEAHYTSLIRSRIDQLNSTEGIMDEEREEFLAIMDEMDEEYLQLKSELNEDLSNQRIIEAMIQNYRQRLDLLEQLMVRLNHQKTDRYEKQLSM